MARYEHLPIYKTAMDLAVYLEQVVRNFSRYHKYTLGSDLRQQSRELLRMIHERFRCNRGFAGFGVRQGEDSEFSSPSPALPPYRGEPIPSMLPRSLWPGGR